MTARVLCVAEKPSIAKSITQLLSGGQYATRPSQNRYIRNYDFAYPRTNSAFTVTSVSGHVMEHDFDDAHRAWTSCDPFALFDAPIISSVSAENKTIERNLLAEARKCDTLMIWTDCDREGEHIGSEIAQICRRARPNIVVKRARFSAIIPQQIHNAAQHPTTLDLAQAAAVEARIILDLRIGAAFTRMQTFSLQGRFPKIKEQAVPVSYGPCQFPTLGFVVSQYKRVKEFVPEPFWYIYLSLQRGAEATDFLWDRGRLFEYNRAAEIYETVLDDPLARVVKVTKKGVKKWKPYPLTTVELQKAASRLLKLAPKNVLDIAERLYQQGFLSYPRTETDQFDSQFDLMTLIAKQTADGAWGNFAVQLQGGGFDAPRRGRNNDKAHPPIHPTAHVANLVGDEKKVYEYITRRFLACCSKDAEGWETKVDIMCGGDAFHASGLVVTARNYLDVFTYDKWNGKAILDFAEGEVFEPTVCELREGQTTSPSLLTEADLVGLMDKNGIGTDATIATHIQVIVDRGYVVERMEGNTKHLIPSTLGIGLIEGYNEIGFDKSLSKPQLRSETEQNMAQVCEGTKTKNDMLVEAVEQYKDIFIKARREFGKVFSSVQRYLERDDNARNDDDGTENGGSNGGGGGKGGGGGRGSRGGRGGRGGLRGRAASTRGTVTARGRSGRGRGRVTSAAPTIVSDDDDAAPPPPPVGAPRSQPRQFRSNSTAPSAPLQPCGPSIEVKCRCGVPAAERTVTKEASSKGRRFRTCGNDRTCEFFEWMDGPPSAGTSESTVCEDIGGSSSSGTSSRAITQPVQDQALHGNDLSKKCLCDLTAVRRTVTKDGPTQGRVFWSCPNSQKARCDYFLWDDERGASDECFKCNQKGHWANACPNQPGNAGQPPPRTRSFGSQADNAAPGACYKCGEHGHYSSSCPGEGISKNKATGGSGARATGRCFKCDEEGHWSNACPHLGGGSGSGRGRGTRGSKIGSGGRGSRGGSSANKRGKKKSAFGAPDE